MKDLTAKADRAALLRRLFREDPSAFAELVEDLNPPRPERSFTRHHAVASYPRLRVTLAED